ERTGSQLIGLEHLAKQVIVQNDLFAPADQPVVLVVRMSHVTGPTNKPVSPGHSVYRERTWDTLPDTQPVRSGEHDVSPGSGLEHNRRGFSPRLLEDHVLTVNTVFNQNPVARPGHLGRSGNGLPGMIGGTRSLIVGIAISLSNHVGCAGRAAKPDGKQKR